MEKLITHWYEDSIRTPSYSDVLELVYDSDSNTYYIVRHSSVGNIIEKIKLIPETVYKLDS
jgi:hypothetical protein